jgi:hypothetical protein
LYNGFLQERLEKDYGYIKNAIITLGIVDMIIETIVIISVAFFAP